MTDSERNDGDELERMLSEYRTSRDPRLRDAIVDATSWLAMRGARRFANRGEPVDDLLQVARIGLLKAIDRFDPAFGVHFPAYATPTIMGELRRHFRDHTWSVHVSRRAKDLRPAVNRTVDDLTKELGRSPRVDEIAGRLGAPDDAVLEALEANNLYRSEQLDLMGDKAPGSFEASFDTIADRDLITSLLERLAPRERTILYLRYFEELSQAQIAARVGTSQVHVSRLIASSLQHLRAVVEHEQTSSGGGRP